MNIEKLFTDSIKEELIKKTIEFLKIPSELDETDPNTPYGKEIKRALDHMLALGEKDNFITKNVFDHAGHIEFGEGEEVLGMLCHVDVVPANDTELWDTDPYDPVIKDGKIFARGATDDKGPVFAVYYAMKILRDAGFKPTKKVRLILGCDEETGMRGVHEYLKHEKTPEIGFSPDASYPLIYGEKGITRFDIKGNAESNIISFNAGNRYNVVPDKAVMKIKDFKFEKEFNEYLKETNYSGEISTEGEVTTVTTFGKSGHAMEPEKYLSAASVLFKFMEDKTEDKFIKFACDNFMFDHTGEKLGLFSEKPEWGTSSMNVGIINYEAGSFSFGVDYRYPQGFDFTTEVLKVSNMCKENDLDFDLGIHKGPHYVSPESDFVKTLMSSYQKFSGDLESKPFTIGGGTYSRVLPVCVAYGPEMSGRETNIHQPNENIHIEDLYSSVLIYADAIYNLTK